MVGSIKSDSKTTPTPSKNPPKTSKEMKANQIAAGVEAMKISSTPMSKSKNLDVLKEFANIEKKNAANFVVIGMALYF